MVRIAYNSSTFTPRLLCSDGEKVEYNGVLLRGGRDEDAEGLLAPGEEYAVRVFFEIPATVKATTLYFAEGDSRVYAFPVGDGVGTG